MFGEIVTVQTPSGGSITGVCIEVDFLGNPIEIDCSGIFYIKCGDYFIALRFNK